MQKPLTKIAIVICFIGKLPWYFNYYLHSCSFNPTIDFYIFTDDNTFFGKGSENVKFHKINLAYFNSLATIKLGFEIDIKFSYKLCDFKPAFGLIFEDYLHNYDIWGFGDIDVIYGNIRNFMTDDILNEFEVISVRPDWLPGCFVLLQNTKKMTNLFKESKDYKTVFTTEKHYCFDETNFAHDAFTEGLHFSEIKTEIESFMHVIKKQEEYNQLKVYYDLHIVEGIPGKLKWENGLLFYRNIYDVMLYHMIRLKRNYKSKRTFNQIPLKYKISPKKIYI